MPYWVNAVFEAIEAERKLHPEEVRTRVHVPMNTLQDLIPIAQRQGSNSDHSDNACFSFGDARFLEKQLDLWHVTATHEHTIGQNGHINDYMVISTPIP